MMNNDRKPELNWNILASICHNQVFLKGFLLSAPTLIQQTSERKALSMCFLELITIQQTIKNNMMYSYGTFHQIVVYGKTAEFAVANMKPFDVVSINGEIRHCQKADEASLNEVNAFHANIHNTFDVDEQTYIQSLLTHHIELYERHGRKPIRTEVRTSFDGGYTQSRIHAVNTNNTNQAQSSNAYSSRIPKPQNPFAHLSGWVSTDEHDINAKF